MSVVQSTELKQSLAVKLQESYAITKITAQCPENFPDSLTTPTATTPNIFMGFCSDRPYEWFYKIWSP